MGQERCRAMPKGDLNHADTRSKIGHRRVRKREVLRTSLFFVPEAGVRRFGGGVAELSALRQMVAAQLSCLKNDCT